MRARSMIAALALMASTGFAGAADQTAPTVITDMVMADTACAKQSVLGRIKDRFAWAELTQWHRGFVIESIANPRPTNHPYAEPGIVARDYCMADSVMSNSSAHPVYYAIERRLGFAGLGSDVDFCVLGLDPWHVHDADCRTVR